MSTKNRSEMLFGKTRQAILSLLLNHPNESFYLRQIQRETGSALGAVQRELILLLDMGIICVVIIGNRKYYQDNPESPINNDLKNILNKIASSAASDQSPSHIFISANKLEQFSKRHHIRKLALYGSVLRDDFRPDSDVDILVEFEEGCTPGFGMVSLEVELSGLLGRRVDLRTPEDLSHLFREQVMRESEVKYDATR
jgi:predicted nucleotidyltransferase/DNA-binding transcriptional ArsR family regulator